MEPRTKTCGPYPVGLIVTHTQINAKEELQTLPQLSFPPKRDWFGGVSQKGFGLEVNELQ